MLRLGYKASAEQFGPRELLEFGIAAEQAGFDSVMVSDHFQPWKHEGGHAPHSFTWLSALGASTGRVMLGTSVATPTFRYHPAIVAQTMATMALLYPGRVMLGIGTGESLNEVPATGMAWPPMKERFGRMREAVRLMRLLWTEERVSFDGEFYRTDNATIYDRPELPVPVYVAAAGPMVAKYAGRAGDGYITTSGKPMSLYTDKLLPSVAEGRTLASQEVSDYDMMLEVKVSFDHDRARALEDTRHWAALALSQEEKMSVEDPREMQRLADALPIERVASRWIVSDDVEAQLDGIAPYVALGFNHLVFHAPGPDQRRFIELYGREVLPALRERFG